MKLATIVKMNESEIDEVCAMLGNPKAGSGGEAYRRELMVWLRENFSLEGIAVTRGEKGAWLLAGGDLLSLPDSDLDQSLVRPVGAGDAFAAGLLFGVVQKWEPTRYLRLAVCFPIGSCCTLQPHPRFLPRCLPRSARWRLERLHMRGETSSANPKGDE